MMKPKYFAKPVETLKDKPGCWDSYRIGVFRQDGDAEVQVGEYKRNYSFLKTFAWFTKDGKDYALYSPEYTATRIMALPSCKDIGGEESDGNGFCPVEFYVPSFIVRELVSDDPRMKDARYRIYEPAKEDGEKEGDSKLVQSLTHEDFALLCGCVWGDDTSWKIQHLDLSKVDKGILVRDDRFGYIELPGKLELKGAVDIDDDCDRIRIAHEQSFDRDTGHRWDPDLDRVKDILTRAGFKRPESGKADQQAGYPLIVGGKDYQALLDLFLPKQK